MVHDLFKNALTRRYEATKSQHPTEGRRRWRLRVLYELWPLLADNSVAKNGSFGAPTYDSDPDPSDPVLEDGELGLIIRTDFSNDESWNTFLHRVQIAQKELLSELTSGDAEEPTQNVENEEGTSMATDSEPSENAQEEDSDSSSESPDIVKILNPSHEADRIKLKDISNIAALRLFNDVDIHCTPLPPPGTKRISPPNPLIDQGGWQEIYTGKHLWIYDTKSISDECVRLVSQQGDVYGTASGDSWRARASHICELQFSISYHGLKIDFGGLDRWDWNERERNLKECEIL
ncbi:hypothetical protein GALMADRAFT_249382 [Galerina marginata CBS 339.88]|uniref:Uncharacterized protein n=1 Tax=Galerina marginata (strain CBS 339.88) TaxID=685588 RepID=A0A067SWR5_GALM3|nr:hypothetical protein GALMADRAFT_249382 [Galerina marginata CBS 339.88]